MPSFFFSLCVRALLWSKRGVGAPCTQSSADPEEVFRSMRHLQRVVIQGISQDPLLPRMQGMPDADAYDGDGSGGGERRVADDTYRPTSVAVVVRSFCRPVSCRRRFEV